jgi:YD repeat-containing protein
LHTKQYFEDSTSWQGGNGDAEQTTTYTLDAFGRVVVIEEDTNGTSGTIERTTTDTYDDLGQLVAVTSPEGTIRYEYDEHTGLMTRTYTGLADDAHTSTASDGKAITDTRYGYDSLGRLVSVTVVECNDTLITPETTEYRYDLVGNLDKVRLPNEVVSDYTYDQLNRLTQLKTFDDDYASGTDWVFDEANENLLAQFDYDLLLDGKRSGVTEKQLVIATLQDEERGQTLTISTARLLLLICFGLREHIGGHVGHGRKG